MHHVDEIGLVGHHLVDILVGTRDLVEHALVLAAFDALRLLREIGARVAALRFAPAHAAPGPVSAGAERLGVALAAHDVGARAHAARDDAELALARPDRALAGDVDELAEMLFLLHVVVMAVDRLAGNLERRKVAAKRLEDQLEHLAPVGECVVLRPPHRFDVVFEELRALAEPAKIAVGQVDVGLHHRLASSRDEILPDAVADAAAARMQHHPDAFTFVEAKLDEMVAAAEGAHLPHPFLLVVALHLGDLRMLAHHSFKAPLQRCTGVAPCIGLAMLVESHGDRTLDRRAQASEAVGKLLRPERKPHGVHAAADVHTHCRGNDRAPRRDDRADRRADPGVHVGHRRDMAEHDRKLRHVRELRSRVSFELVRENLDRDTAALDDLPDGHGWHSTGAQPAGSGHGNILLQMVVLRNGGVTFLCCNRREARRAGSGPHAGGPNEN